MKLRDLLKLVSVDKKYEYIQDIIDHDVVRRVTRDVVYRCRSSRHSKDEVKDITLTCLKELLLSNYVYQDEHTEAKFVVYLQRALMPLVIRYFKMDSPYQEIPKGDTKECIVNPDDNEDLCEELISEGVVTEYQAEILKLTYEQRMTSQEISELYGVSQQAISRAKNRALKRVEAFVKKGL